MSDSDSDSTSDEDYVPKGEFAVHCNSYGIHGVERPVVKLVLHLYKPRVLLRGVKVLVNE